MRRDNFAIALGTLTDLTLSRRESLARFYKLSRRWSPASTHFALHTGGICRLIKEQRVFDETALSTWCDDGGRA